MSEAPLMNDETARSTTGEIIDQSTVAKIEPAKTEPLSTTTTDPKPIDPSATTTDPKVDPPKDPKAPAGAPEAYAAYTLPEGLALAPETVTKANEIFKTLGLSQEQAQSLVAFHAEQLKAATADPTPTYATMRKDWAAKTLADPEISAHAKDGKTGIDAVKLDIGRTLGTLDPTLATDFRAAMDLTGAGDHPAFVKAFWKLSQKITEGSHVAGAGPSAEGQRKPGDSAKPSPAKSLYPNLS